MSKTEKLAGRIEAKEGERSEAVEKAAQARRALGSESDEERLSKWDADIVGELAAFARRAEKTRAAKYAFDSKMELLQAEADGKPAADQDALNQAIRLLHRWLAYERDRSGRFSARHVLLAAAGGSLVLSIGMSVLVHWSWIMILVVAAGLAAWTFWPRRDSDRRAEIRRELEGLRVNAPKQWTDEAVQITLRELQRQSADAALDQERSFRRRSLDSDSRSLAAQ